jgi:hypothetical protein
MLDKITSHYQSASSNVFEKLNFIGNYAREKVYNLIESWLVTFPILEENDLNVKSFGVNLGLSPSLEVELEGDPNVLTEENLALIIEKVKSNKPATSVFKSILTAIKWHKKMGVSMPFDKILVKLNVKITPEVKVFLGTPQLT